MGVKIDHKNPKWIEQFKMRLKKQCDKEVAVGFPAGKDGIASPHYENGASILEVAVWNNFGTEDIPARPFMDNAAPKLQKAFKKLCTETQKDVNSGKISPETVLKTAALQSEGIIRNEITDGEYAPNAPSTVAEKKSSKPLIDSGDMRKYVTGVVRGKR